MIIGFIVVLSSFFAGLFILNNKLRAKPIELDELKPNLLMAQSRLVFVEGKKSIVYYKSYWNQIPNYLRQHGFFVDEAKLSWRNSEERLKEIRLYLEQRKHPMTLFFHESAAQEAIELSKFQHPYLESIHILTAQETLDIPDDINGERKYYIHVHKLDSKPKLSFTGKSMYKALALIHKQFVKTQDFDPFILGVDKNMSSMNAVLPTIQEIAERELLQP
ncbi:MAG: hypothetical protein AB8E15_13025 [Bdellovibrionales bacterium]